MIIDLFPFFNELDILKMRLEILDSVVDRFVIEESRYTFSGQPKELCFEKNKEMFDKWLPKIEYVVVNERYDDVTTHVRDVLQKNHLIEGLKDAKDEDILIIGDVDEIPNPDAIRKLLESFDDSKVYHFAQRLFYGFLNLEEISGNLLSITGEFDDYGQYENPDTAHKKWLGTKAISKRIIPKEGIIAVRDIAPGDGRSVRVEDGGWHFSYMGSHHETDAGKRIRTKVVAAAHQEYNTEDVLKEVTDRLLLGQDMFGRDARFVRVDIDDSFPEYLRENISEYDYLVLPYAGWLKKLLIRIKLPTFRLFRKVRRRLGRLR